MAAKRLSPKDLVEDFRGPEVAFITFAQISLGIQLKWKI